MRQLVGLLLFLLLVAAPTGCSTQKQDETTNPELKVPEVPPSSRDAGGKKSPEEK